MATRIEADVLIPGSGDSINKGCVIFEGRILSYAGPIENAPRPSSSDLTVSAPVVMPGLWDCHTHFQGLRNATVEEQLTTDLSVSLLRSVADAGKALRAGFTSVRELGGHGIQLNRGVKEGSIPGPHIYGAGTYISQTGGHNDIHALPIEFVQYWANLREVPGPCDGITECRRAVRKVLRLGAAVVKVAASGGVMSELDNPVNQQFSDEELRAMVEEANRAGRIVAAHCHGKAGIMAALRAGAHTIEHGSYLDDEAADLMLEKGAMLVPTRLIIKGIAETGEKSGLPAYMMEKTRAVVDRHLQSMRLAIRRKIPIAMGTDIFGSSSVAPAYWGENGRELTYLVEEGGMSPLEAIQAATADAPRTLGPMAPKSGQLRAGFDADVIVVKEDPLKRISVLGQPENILRVWKDGKLEVERPLGG
jgi:imidazolonepropionase-like amidohydrolase